VVAASQFAMAINSVATSLDSETHEVYGWVGSIAAIDDHSRRSCGPLFAGDDAPRHPTVVPG
jgi:hypothetical protein